MAPIPLRNRIIKKFIECTVMQTYRYEYDYGYTICRQCHFTCRNNKAQFTNIADNCRLIPWQAEMNSIHQTMELEVDYKAKITHLL